MTATVSTSTTRRLAAFVSELRFEDIPDDVVEAAKLLVLDCIGCTVYAARLPWSSLLQAYVASDGPASVWGTSLRATPALAALVNGTAGHGFEIDDVEPTAGLHVGSTTLPPALALAEEAGGATGRELIAAVVAGAEAGIRVGAAIFPGHFLRGYHPQGTVGPIAAAAAAARMRKLDAELTASAFGLAGSMAAGLMGAQQGGMVKRLHAGRAGEAGVVSAELAERGFTGTSDVFDLDFGGYCSTLEGVPGAIGRLEGELADIGDGWRVHQIGYKPYASCAANHTSLDVARRLRAEHDLDGSRVAAVRITTSHHTYVHCGWEYEPRDVTNAQMSLRYGVAAMLLTGSAFVDQYTEERIHAADAVALARRIEVVPDESIDAQGSDRRHTVHVEIETDDGTVLTGDAVQRRGSAHLPLSPDEIVEKFRGLADEVPGLDADAMLECVRGLDTLDDVRRLTGLMRMPGGVA